MPQRPVVPTNSILVSGTPIYEEYEVETATGCKPGALVITGSASHQVVVATDNSVAVLGVLDVMPGYDKATMWSDDTDYAANTQVRVIRGDCVVTLRALHSAAITVGLKVQCAGSGKVDQYATANADVGIAEVAHAAQANDSWINVKLTNL